MTEKKTTYFALLVAHLLLFLSFTEVLPFWPMFTVALFLLSVFAIYKQRFKNELNFTSLWLGALSGFTLYLIFAVGKQLLIAIGMPVEDDLNNLYAIVSPTEVWHYIVLVLIIIPGEELFWRGHIQEEFSTTSKWKGIFLATFLYASAHIYSGSTMLMIAAIVGGIFWGTLYAWKKNIVLVSLSHFTFNLFLIVLLPLN